MKTRRCSKTTNTGRKCSRAVVNGESYCWQHKNTISLLERRGSTKTKSSSVLSTKINKLDKPHWSKQRCTAPDSEDSTIQCRNLVKVFMSSNEIGDRKSFFCKQHLSYCGESRMDYKNTCGDSLPSCKSINESNENLKIRKQLISCANKRKLFTGECVAPNIRDDGHLKIIEIVQDKAGACSRIEKRKKKMTTKSFNKSRRLF